MRGNANNKPVAFIIIIMALMILTAILTFFGMQTAINMMNQRSDLQLVGGVVIIVFIGILWGIVGAKIVKIIKTAEQARLEKPKKEEMRGNAKS